MATISNPLLSMLHTTCRERYMRPTQPDENRYEMLTFLSPDRQSLTARVMTEINGGVPLQVPVGGPDASVLAADNMYGVGASTGSASKPSIMTRSLSEWSPSGELYLRLVTWYPTYMGGVWKRPSYTICVILDDAGDIIFKLEALWDGLDRPEGVPLKLTYKDGAGVQRVVDLAPPQGFVRDTRWMDIRVKIPSTGVGNFSYYQYGLDTLIAETTLSPGLSDSDDMVLTILSDDGVQPSGNSTRTNRLGIGNRITGV